MDVLNQRKKQLGQPTTPQAGDIAAQQATAATGKVGRAGAGPAMSNIGAQMATQAGQVQRQGLGIQGMQQQQALSAQEQAQADKFKLGQQGIAQQQQLQESDILAQQTMQDQQRQSQEEMALKERQAKEAMTGQKLSNQYATALADLASQRGIAEQSIFEEARQLREELSYDKYRSYLDQVTHAAAMSDQQYIDQINRIGQERNLKDEIEFKKEASRIAFGNDYEILAQGFDMQELINADSRQSKEILANMDINMAINLAEMAAKEAAYKNMITGATNMASGLVANSEGSGSQQAAPKWDSGTSVTSSQAFNPASPATQTSAYSTKPKVFDPDITMTPASGYGI